ncbi:MAG: hypothetical protein JNL45_17315 [Hyphomicrobium sp.]|nr:hypothetical protein [Hyphomicrobium sp.]
MASRLNMPVLYGICIGLGLVVASQSGRSGPSFRPELVQCYPSTPATAGPGASNPDSSGSAAVALRTAREAVSHCRSGWCDRQTRSQLHQSLTAYLAYRRTVTNSLYQTQGTAGLEEAARLFSSANDVALTEELAALFARGGLSFDDLPEERPALALVLTKPANAFKPCQALRQASPTAAPYVY